MGGGILEVLILLPFVLHQSQETFHPFLLPVKVANLVSFKVHDETNVGQTGTENISDCRTSLGSLRHLTCRPARTVWPSQDILLHLRSFFAGFSLSGLRNYFLLSWSSHQVLLSSVFQFQLWNFSFFSSSSSSEKVSSYLQWISWPSSTQS